MRLLAIDPGYVQSAYLILEDGALREFDIQPNRVVIETIRAVNLDYTVAGIEMVASYGMAVGREVFETVYWIGRFDEAIRYSSGINPQRIERMKVKMHLCHNSRASDSNIRQALLDRYGPGQQAACGTKGKPGPLYGIKKDLWAALALAVTVYDLSPKSQFQPEPANVEKVSAPPLFEEAVEGDF